MRVTITVPANMNLDNAPARWHAKTDEERAAFAAKILDSAKRDISAEFGGFTAYEADGGWVDGDGNLIEERVTVIESYTSKPASAHLVAERLARSVMLLLYQDAAMYTVNNQAHFVSNDWS